MNELKPIINELSTTSSTTLMQVIKDGNDFPSEFKVVSTYDELLDGRPTVDTTVYFQKGAVKEVGVNGVMDPDVLNMVLIRLKYFQDSEYGCRENEKAIEKIEEALMWLRKRTTRREIEGKLGTSKV